jgi:hypothetical protein
VENVTLLFPPPFEVPPNDFTIAVAVPLADFA